MSLAIEEAEKAAIEGEVPVGAVAVFEDRLIASDHNRCIQLQDATAHAEILVLRAAGAVLSNYRLNGVEVYTTLEPCPMCCGALIWARVSRLVFATHDAKAGAVSSKAALLEPGLFNHTVETVAGVMAEESREMLRRFFAERR